jgi:hypothetical protein
MGGLIGGAAGACLGLALNWAEPLGQNLLANVVWKRLEDRSLPWKRDEHGKQLNHDLQEALRMAVRESLIDIGGPECFGKEWQRGRPVPDSVQYHAPRGSILRPQPVKLLAGLLRDVVTCIDKGELLPLDPPPGRAAGDVQSYLRGRVEALSDELYEITIAQRAPAFPQAFAQLPGLEAHLRRHLFARTLVHLPEEIKRNTSAWRAFNRWLLEDMRDRLEAADEAHAADLQKIQARLDHLLSVKGERELGGLADATADALAGLAQVVQEQGRSIEAALGQLARDQKARFDEILVELGYIRKTGEATHAAVVGVAKDVQEILRKLQVGKPPRPRREVLKEYCAAALRTHDAASGWWSAENGTELPLTAVYVRQVLLPYEAADGTASQPIAGGEPEANLLIRGGAIVVAEPGAGKTLLLHRIGGRLAAACDVLPNGHVAPGSYVPLYLSLSGWGAQPDALDAPALALIRQASRSIAREHPEVAGFLDEILQEGKIVLLLDGLEEAGDSKAQAAVLRGIAGLVSDRGAACPVILTARETAFGRVGKALPQGMRVFRLSSLDAVGRASAIRQWVAAVQCIPSGEQDLIEKHVAPFEAALARAPEHGKLLRNPLLLALTLQAYLADGDDAQRLPPLARRFGAYADRLLAAVRQQNKNVDAATVARGLELLATALHEGPGWLTQAAAEVLLTRELGWRDVEVRALVRSLASVQLLVLHSAGGGDPVEDVLVRVGPHALFGHYFAARGFARLYREDRRRGLAELERRAQDPLWEQTVLFALSELTADTTPERVLVEFVGRELERRPLWGIRCLHEGLDTTLDTLPAADQRALRGIALTKADLILNPRKLNAVYDRIGEDHDAYNQVLYGQYDALKVLAQLSVCEAGERLLEIALASSDDKDGFDFALRKALGEFPARCLWPRLRPLLQGNVAWQRREAAIILLSWRTPDSLPALQEALEILKREPEYAKNAVSAIALTPGREADRILRQLLREPAWQDEALRMALLGGRPGMLPYALERLSAGGLGDSDAKFLIEYACGLGETDARTALCGVLEVRERLNLYYVFQVQAQYRLPLLRLLTPLLRDPLPALSKAASEAIEPLLYKGDPPDLRLHETRRLLEQCLLYGDDMLPRVVAKMLRDTMLSAETADELLTRLKGNDLIVLALLDEGLKYPQPQREELQNWLVAHREEFSPERWVVFAAKAGVALSDAELTALVPRAGSPEDVDETVLRLLVQRRNRAAFPFVMRRLRERPEGHWECATALARLAPVLAPQERSAAADALRPNLAERDVPLRLSVAYALAQLGQIQPPELFAQLRDNDPEVQEPVIGHAVALLGDFETLLPHLTATVTQRDAFAINAALYAYGALGDTRAIAPLLRILDLPSEHLRRADDLWSHGDMGLALQHVKGLAAITLGKIVGQSIGPGQPLEQVLRAWRIVAGQIDQRALAPDTALVASLGRALSGASPAGQLYEHALASTGLARQECLWLLAAYEWSEVAAHISRCKELDAFAAWRAVSTYFRDIESSQQEILLALAQQELAWPGDRAPFSYCAQLAASHDGSLHSIPRYYVARAAREWADWLPWRQQWLEALPA